MSILREAAGVPFGLPASRWMLEVGAIWMRTDTELILKSRRVVPARLLEHGFTFRYPDWRSAAADLCRGGHCPTGAIADPPGVGSAASRV
jgi:NAD dependent epimerase/dehydratase family enzyme